MSDTAPTPTDTGIYHGPMDATRASIAEHYPGCRVERIGWAWFRLGARNSQEDTGRIHGPMTAKVASLQDAAERFERFDTGREHGPALPTGAQLAVHAGIGFGRYFGPWVTRSGFRVDGPRPTRRIPNPADLPRPTRRTV